MSKTLTIKPRFRDLIPPLSPEELADLESSILTEGCRDPLVTWGVVVVDGHHRYEICQRHGKPFKTVDKIFADENEAEIWMIKNQFARRNLAPYTRAELALKLEPLIAENAKRNQKAGGAKSGGNGKVVRQKSDKPLDTKKEVAKLAGLSHDTIAKAKLIQAHADEETKQKLRTNQTSIHEVAKAIKAAGARKSVEPERDETPGRTVTSLDELAGEKFGTIYADPPWKYGNQKTRGATDNHYETMTVEEICNMPVPNLAANDSHLHLWATSTLLPEALRVMAAWGFEYRSSFVWCKPQIGMGNYWRVSHEILLLGIRGNAKSFFVKDLRSWIEADRAEHSAKPEAIRGYIERASPGPFLELFGRKKVIGWTAFGNQFTNQKVAFG